MDLRLNKNTFQKDVSGLGAFTKGMFQGMAQAAVTAFSVYAIGKFIKSSVELSSKLAEVQNVVDVTFGQSVAKINDFAKSTSKSYGLSEYAAKKYTGVAGSMYKSMGFGAETASDMSIEMAKLAGDFASFYDLDADAAFEKIRSGISGETEPLKQLGVNLSVANLEAYAMKKGITQAYGAMSQQNQALLRYNYLLDSTKDAQGDFSRTSGSWANQTRLLRLQWDSFKASMGNAFRMILMPIIQMINAIIPRLNAMAVSFTNFVAAVSGKSVPVTTASVAVASIGEEATASAIKTEAASKRMKRSLMGFDEINVLSKKSESGGTAGGGTTIAPVTSPTTGGTLSQTQTEISGFAKFLQDHSTAILATVGGLMTGIASYFVIGNWATISAGIVKAITAIGTAISGISLSAMVIPAIIGLVTAAVITLWNTNEEFKNAIIGAWNGIKDSFNLVYNTVLAPIFKSFTDMLKDVWNSGVKPLWNGFLGFVNQVVLLVTDLWNAFKPVFDWFVKTFGPLLVTIFQVAFDSIGSAIKFAMSVFKIFFDFISGTISSIRTIFSGLVTFVTGVFSGNWSKAWDGIKTIFSGIWDGIKNYLVSVVNMMVSGLNWLIKQALVPVNALIKGWNNTVGKVTGKISEVSVVIPTIEKFANGGVIDSPTLGLMGEYAGAKSNKEIVTPEKLMMEVVLESLKEFFKNFQFGGSDQPINIYLDSELIEEVLSKKSTLRLQAANGRG